MVSNVSKSSIVFNLHLVYRNDYRFWFFFPLYSVPNLSESYTLNEILLYSSGNVALSSVGLFSFVLQAHLQYLA